MACNEDIQIDVTEINETVDITINEDLCELFLDVTEVNEVVTIIIEDACLPTGEGVGFTWMDLVARPSIFVVDLPNGKVRKHVKTGEADIFRFIPNPYDPILDAFYGAFDGSNLTDLITTRG